MKVLIFTLGSRGDVQPFLALAAGLLRAGHRVTLATAREFTPLIEAYGVGTHPVRFSVQAMMQDPEVRAVMRGRNPVKQFRLMQGAMVKSAEAMDDFWEAAQTADFIVQTGTGNGGIEAAGQRGLPLAIASVIPFKPTRAFPPFFLPLREGRGGGFNLMMHRLAHAILWRGLGGPATNRWRKQRLGLRPWRSYAEMYAAAQATGTPWLLGYSPSALPKPADWGDEQHVTGYWFLAPPGDWQPPADLLRFLDEGKPPVYVGYGSMGDVDPEQVTRLVLEALRRTGQRGVLLTGWGGLQRAEGQEGVYFVEDVPHAWLFPQMAAVAHHGGAGTTGAGLRSGVPSIVLPLAGDQHAWAGRVAALGVGPRAGRLAKLTVEGLAKAIDTAVNDTGMRARAAALGEKIRAEDGVGTAVGIIERHAAARRAKEMGKVGK
jgi:UDP:flavonoid glycosyltransferase YjiC (YdhE family)